jgi:hypothetical protein
MGDQGSCDCDSLSLSTRELRGEPAARSGWQPDAFEHRSDSGLEPGAVDLLVNANSLA